VATRRGVAPVAGRRQTAAVPPPAPVQTLLPNALLMPLDQIIPDPGQPRRHFDETGLAELVESIEQEGVLQPLIVREDGALEDGRIRYMILDGERRYRAALRVRSDVPVLVVSGGDITEVRIRQLIANLQREELDPLEEALALRQLMQLSGLGIKNIAKRIGKPAVYVQRRNDLLFDPRLTEAVRRGEINASVAVELRRFPEDVRHGYLERVNAGERLEVAQLREAKRTARDYLGTS
jgi:ParB family chromosome partitioning protein